jgi:hypothetical protein
VTQESDIEAQIAEFTRAERRRKARVYAIGGIVLVLLGIGALIVALTVGEPETGSARYEIKVLVAGIVLTLTGGAFLVSSWRIGTGRVADVDFDVPRSRFPL